MDNLLFYTLLALLLWYFFYYSPAQKSQKPSASPRPFKHASTQTDPVKTTIIETEPGPESEPSDTKALEQTLTEMTKSMLELSKDLDKY